MSLKSLVNKSIIKSDIRRFWYLCALFLGAILLTVTIPVIERADYMYNDVTSFGRWDFWSMANTGIIAILPFGIIIPTILFSYLHKKSAVCATHSLPLKRECVFFSHIAASAILTLVPIIVNAVIMLSINKLYAPDILKWAVVSVVYCILFGGMSVLSSSIAGNIFAAMAIPAVMMLLPIYSVSMFEVLADEYLFGFTYMGGTSLSTMVGKWYLAYKSLLGINSLIYIAMGIVFCAIGFVCYKKRALENNSSVTAFKVLNPVFMYGLAIFGGLLGVLYINEIIDIFSIWFAIPFGIIGIIVAKMLILKTFKPQKIIKPSLIYIAILFVIYAFVGLDITGFEKRIPDLDEIAYVDVSGNSRVSEYTNYEDKHVMRAPEARHNTKLTDKADIEKVLALHKNIAGTITMRTRRDTMSNNTIPIMYKLKNGKTMSRHYWYSATDEQKAQYFDIQDIPTVKAYTYPVLSNAEREYVGGAVETCGFNRKELTSEQIAKLIAALREDIPNTSVRDMQGEPITRIDFEIKIPLVDEDGNRVEADVYLSRSEETYYVRPQYTKTIKLLTAWGMYKAMPVADDVERIWLFKVAETGAREEMKNITDRSEIQKYLDYFANAYDIQNQDSKNIHLEINYKNGSGWSIRLPELPQI